MNARQFRMDWASSCRPLYRLGHPRPARAPTWFGRLIDWIARR